MFRNRKNIWLLLLSGYFSLFIAACPGGANGAMLQSEFSVPGSPDHYGAASLASVRLVGAGLNRPEAWSRITGLLPGEINQLASGSMIILAGSGVQYPHENVVSEVGYVFLLLVVGVGLAAVALSR